LKDTVPINVMLTMRADYIGDCIRFERLPEAISDGQYLVPRLIREQLEEVIRQPIKKADAAIDDDLVEQLLNDSAKEPDSLYLLQHVLMRLWDEAQKTTTPVNDNSPGSTAGQRRLTMDLYKGLGGMSDALSSHANEVVKQLPIRAAE